jgi:GTPase SAR1 family protein
MLGDMNVGKTSMALRFVRNQFFEYQDNTIGGASKSPLALLSIVLTAVPWQPLS